MKKFAQADLSTVLNTFGQDNHPNEVVLLGGKYYDFMMCPQRVDGCERQFSGRNLMNQQAVGCGKLGMKVNLLLWRMNKGRFLRLVVWESGKKCAK